MTELLDQGVAASGAAEYDYLLMPTTACVSWPAPGISLPNGSGRDGLPVGLQIVVPLLRDRPQLAMAQRAEAALG